MRALGWLAVIALTAATVAGFLARMGYPAELFSHFRPHYAAAALLGACLAAALRYRWLLAAGLGVFAVNATATFLPLAGAVPSSRGEAPPSLTVVWANVQGRLSALTAVARLAEAENADAVALTEVAFADADFSALFPSHPCLDDPAASGPFNVVLLTRAPCADAGTASPDFWPWAARIVQTELGGVVGTHPARPFEISALHPRPPLASDERRSQRDRVIHAALATATAREATLLVGDFNATPWSPIMVDVVRAGFRPVDCGAPWRSTWLSRAPLLGLPIDLAYAGPTVRAARCRVGAAVGSDHFPLVIQLWLSEAPS